MNVGDFKPNCKHYNCFCGDKDELEQQLADAGKVMDKQNMDNRKLIEQLAAANADKKDAREAFMDCVLQYSRLNESYIAALELARPLVEKLRRVRELVPDIREDCNVRSPEKCIKCADRGRCEAVEELDELLEGE